MPISTCRRRIVSTFCSWCALLCGSTASAETLQELSIFELLDRSDVVALARPADWAKDSRVLLSDDLIVEEVLRGHSSLETEYIRVDLRAYRHLCSVQSARSAAGEPLVIRRALLFLRRPSRAGEFDYEPVRSGLRYLLTDDGKTLVPSQSFTGGRFCFAVNEQANWDTELGLLREALPIKNALRKLFTEPERTRK